MSDGVERTPSRLVTSLQRQELANAPCCQLHFAAESVLKSSAWLPVVHVDVHLVDSHICEDLLVDCEQALGRDRVLGTRDHDV